MTSVAKKKKMKVFIDDDPRVKEMNRDTEKKIRELRYFQKHGYYPPNFTEDDSDDEDESECSD